MATKEEEITFILECIEVYKNLPAFWNVKSEDYNKWKKKNEQYEHLLRKYWEKYRKIEEGQLNQKFNSFRTDIGELVLEEKTEK